jgi:hypothetical protein
MDSPTQILMDALSYAHMADAVPTKEAEAARRWVRDVHKGIYPFHTLEDFDEVFPPFG